MRWARGAGFLLLLALLLAGPPVILVKVIGWPLHGWPDEQQLRLWIREPLTEQTLAVALTLLAWMLWLLVAYTVAVRILMKIRAGSRWLRRMPLPTPLQATASGMAGAAVFGMTTNTTALAAPEQPAPTSTGALGHSTHTSADATVGLSDAVVDEVVDGVTVPGGWLPRGTAEQVAVALALVWLLRRHRYKPHIPGAPRDDTDLAPLPATAAAVQAALDTQPHSTRRSASTDTSDEQSDRSAALPPPLAHLPVGGVGLVGPGARDAARGILVTALLAALSRRSATHVVIAKAALDALLPHTHATEPWLAGVRITTTAEEAASLVEALLTQSTTRNPSETGNGGEPPILITDELAPAVGDRLTAVGASAVILAPRRTGATWHVDGTGHVRDHRQPQRLGPRLCVLTSPAAADLLTVIGHTRPSLPTPPQQTTPPRLRIPRQATPPSRPSPSSPTQRLQLRVLDTPALLLQGEPVTIRRSAALQTLVFLAVHRDGANSRQLTEALWPGLAAHTVTGRLYTTISDLRATVRSATGLTIIEHIDDRYRLTHDHLDVDLWHLHDAIAQAATAITDQTAAWQDVIDRYSGELAAGHTWPWLEPPRETLRRHVIDAHVALAAAAADPTHAVSLLQDAVRVDPYNEDLHHRAAEALAAIGEHAAARELVDTYSRRLAEAGIAPGRLPGRRVRGSD